MKPALWPLVFYAAGSICFLIGSAIAAWQVMSK